MKSARHAASALTNPLFCILLLMAISVSAGRDDHYASSVPSSLDGLATLPTNLRDQIQAARANLLCAADLPGCQSPTLEESLKTIQEWAHRVRTETDRHLYRFRKAPSEFENSEGFFRMLMLTVVLQEDFGIHYDEAMKSSPSSVSSQDGFFSRPDLVFLQGLIGPKRAGTCSSMPVLCLAVGRELGYPLKLVTTKGHLFVRWEGRGERFNVEATSRGLNRFDDDYYRRWPFPITPEDERREGYLKSLSAREELAVFLSIRGMCFRDLGKPRAAAEAFALAVQFAPEVDEHKAVLAQLRMQLTTQ